MSKECSTNINEIIQYIDIFMPKNYFEYYLSIIFESIKEENNSSSDKKEIGINIFTFNIYLNLPFFISDKIFKTIKNNPKRNILKEKEFINFLSIIYYGTIEERAKLIFKILDFDNDNLIQIDDLKLFSYHFHLIKNIYKDDLDLYLIDEMINPIFENEQTTLSYKEFIQKIKTINSDFLFLMIFFFYKFKPSTIEELELFYLHNTSHNLNENEKNNILDLPLISPSKNLFFYIRKYLGINSLNIIIEDDLRDEEIINELNDFENDFLRIKNSLNIPKEINSISKIKTVLHNNLIIEETTSVNQCKTVEKDRYYLFKSKCEIIITNNIRDLNNENNIKLKKITLYLSGNNLFAYQFNHNNGKSKLNIFVLKKILEIEELGNSVLICYTLNFNPIVLEISFQNELIKNKFLKIFKHSMNYKKIEDYYDINIDIGHGSYGRVFLGKDKKTGKKYAIKSIKKNYDLSKEDQLSIFWELSITKIIKNIQTSNFVKIYNIFESLSNIYIIMEFAGEDLEQSLNNFWPNINIFYEYIKQIANSIYILNKFGIIHRDLKLQNIILSFENDEINDERNYEMKEKLKLIDFGFSKILSHNEKTNESYGTLFYISPEIVNNDYYNYKEDIWTFGIICYYFLTHNFPFFDNEFINFTHSEKILNVVKNLEEKNICLNENNYHDLKGKIIAKIVNLCLIKDINKRASINEIINLLI